MGTPTLPLVCLLGLYHPRTLVTLLKSGSPLQLQHPMTILRLTDNRHDSDFQRGYCSLTDEFLTALLKGLSSGTIVEIVDGENIEHGNVPNIQISLKNILNKYHVVWKLVFFWDFHFQFICVFWKQQKSFLNFTSPSCTVVFSDVGIPRSLPWD